MPTSSSYIRSPKLTPGAFIQLLEIVGGFSPEVVTFQYNPEKISRSFRIYSDGAHNAERGQESPQTQPYVPDESISFSLVLDAADGLGEGRVLEERFGITAKLSAIERLIFASGDLNALVAGQVPGYASEIAAQPRVPTTLLVLGPHRLVPIRITSMSIEEELFAPDLRPIRATVSLSLNVISEEQLRGLTHATDQIARAAYLRHRSARYDLALASKADAAELTLGTFGSVLRL
ncbi:MAG TPA: hypothetical protein ENJ18_03560 [Nannocystis exedens]|nr:hypothetical protein [Nannocystis exedens]